MINKVFTIFCFSAFCLVLMMNMNGTQTFALEINFSEMALGVVSTLVGMKDAFMSVIDWIQGLFTTFVGG